MCALNIKDFCTPEAEFYPGYFWVLNTPMTEENLIGMLRDMNDHGAKSICIHPSPRNWNKNSLAEPEYLSEEYLDLMDKLHAEAEKLNMHSYFYDEGGFPAGTSIGEVLASDPEKFSRQLVERDKKSGKIVINHEYNSDYAYFYPPKGYPNLLEKGVGERFIEVSHEKLKTALGKYFGKSIRYTFDDEAALPGYFKFDTGSLGWCSDFGEEFFKRKGYRIEPFFDGVIGRRGRADTPEDLRHRIDYCDVRSQLFVERFFIPMKKWAKANDLASGGHLGGEDSVEGNLHFCYGHIIRALRALDLPGVDIIWRQIYPKTLPRRKKKIIHKQSFGSISTAAKDTPFTKYASSVAHQAGHNNVLTEDFAAYGAGLTPQVMKFVIDHQLVRGANHFVFSNIPHGYFSKMLSAGCRPKFGKYHPFWDWFDMIHLYIARFSALLQKGKPQVNTLVFMDIRSIWCGGKIMRDAAKLHYASAEKLLKKQIDFDFADDDAIISGKIADGKLRIGKMSYKNLVIPAVNNMDEKAVKVVEKFRQAGGNVITTDEIDHLSATVEVTPAQPDLRVTKRQYGAATLYFITSESPRKVKCSITIPESGNWQIFDAWSGKRYQYPRQGNQLKWQFCPFGSLALMVNSPDPADENYPAFKPGRKKIHLENNWTIQPVRKCVYDKERYAIEPVKADAIPAKLGDWGNYLGKYFSGEAIYKVEFDSPSDAPAKLFAGKVCYVSEAILNGKSLGRSFSDSAEFFTKDALKKGKNILEIRVVNTGANATLDPEVQKYWQENFPPSEYQQMNCAFEAESLESGLFGPVYINFGCI